MPESVTKPSNPVYLIGDGTFDAASMDNRDPADRPMQLDWARREQVPTGARVLLWLSDDRVRELVPIALERHWELGVLPHPDAPRASRLTASRGRIDDLIEHFQTAEAIESDVLTCNGDLVLSCVAIGENLTVKPDAQGLAPSRRRVFIRAVKRLKTLSLGRYSITTAKERKISLAALGMVVMEQPERTLFGRGLAEHAQATDGRVSLMVLAPRSILSYCWFLLRMLLPWPINASRLPPSVGVIASKSIRLDCSRGVEYAVDGIPVERVG